MENKAYVLTPESKRRKYKCTLCHLTYAPKEYEQLFYLKKIIYFSYLPPSFKRPKTVCHACLMSLVKSYNKEEIKISVEIIDKAKKSTWACYSYASQIKDSVFDYEFFP